MEKPLIDSGYLFAKSKDRLFVNISLGCRANCSFCYLPLVGYKKGEKSKLVISGQEAIRLIKAYEHIKWGRDGTLITLGCFSEVWDIEAKEATLEVMSFILSKGNRIQLSTKKKILIEELEPIKPLLQYKNQLLILVSSSTISQWKTHESASLLPSERFKSLSLQEHGIATALYIKPVIKDVTIKDVEKYKDVIKHYGVKYVVVGSMFGDKDNKKTAPFTSQKEHFFYNHINEEDEIKNALTKCCKTFDTSTQLFASILAEA